MKSKNILIFYIFSSLLFTLFILGPQNLSSIEEKWLFSNDRAHDLLVWKYFFKDEWSFPLGLNSNFGLEISNSIPYSGSPTLFALFFKLFNPILPDNFNFYSILILINIFLQLLLGYLIIFQITKDNIFSFFASFLFILSPIFLFKFQYHLSLTSHWLILLYFYIDIRIKNYDKKRNFFLLTVLISSLIHFYFTIILLIMIFLSRLFLLYENKNYYSFFKDSLFYIIALLIMMYFVGYFVLPPQNTIGGGYGQFNLNILSFINPSIDGKSWSNFLPLIYDNKVNEDFGYLGLGILIILFVLIFFVIKNYKKINFNNYKTYILSFVVLFTLALSNNLNFGPYNLFELNLNKYIYAILSLIRASARLVWPCVYLILIFGIYSIFKLNSVKKRTYILIILLGIQTIDLQKGLNLISFGKSYAKDQTALHDSRWQKLNKDIKIFSGINIYNEYNDFEYFVPYFAKYLPQTELSYLARVDRKKQSNLTYLNLKNILKKNNLNKTFYIQTIGQLNHISQIYKDKNFDFINLDNKWFFLPDNKNLMNNEEILFINNLHNINKLYQNYNLNSFSNYKNDESIGLGWYYDKITNNLFSDGNESYLIFNNIDKFKNTNLTVDISNALKQLKEKNIIEIYINNIKYLTFDFLNNNKKQKIEINLEKFKSKNIILKFKILNPKSKFDFKVGIDEKKRGIVLNSYHLSKI